jgi:acylphosphatase
MQKRVHALFEGQVQGVGFRFTAREFAQRTSVAGWVKNLPDGRVEIVAEGQEENLKQFISGMQEYFRRYLRDTRIQWLPPSGEFNDFGVRF